MSHNRIISSGWRRGLTLMFSLFDGLPNHRTKVTRPGTVVFACLLSNTQQAVAKGPAG